MNRPNVKGVVASVGTICKYEGLVYTLGWDLLRLLCMFWTLRVSPNTAIVEGPLDSEPRGVRSRGS